MFSFLSHSVEPITICEQSVSENGSVSNNINNVSAIDLNCSAQQSADKESEIVIIKTQNEATPNKIENNVNNQSTQEKEEEKEKINDRMQQLKATPTKKTKTSSPRVSRSPRDVIQLANHFDGVYWQVCNCYFSFVKKLNVSLLYFV